MYSNKNNITFIIFHNWIVLHHLCGQFKSSNALDVAINGLF